jgi:opacity protein-like surface antigen
MACTCPGASASCKRSLTDVTSSAPAFNGPFPVAGGADFNRYMITVNGFYDVPVGWSIKPYIGIGGGVAHLTESSAVFASADGARLLHDANTSDQLVVLVEAGIAIPITAKLALVPAYRYLRIFDANQGAGDEADHILKLGLRYWF